MSVNQPAVPTPATIAERIIESIGRPLRGASLFYALYWLVEVEGVQAATFDFNQIRDEYHEAFWWYGVYSVARELSHMSTEYLVDGFSVNDHLRGFVRNVELADGTVLEERQLGEGRLDRHARELVEQDVEDLAASVFVNLGALANARPIDGLASEREVEDLFQEIQVISAFRRSRDFIRMTGQVFDNTGFLEFEDDVAEQLPPDPDFLNLFDVTETEWRQLSVTGKARVAELDGWRVGDFDGPGWVGITDHLRRRDGLSRTAWVDQSFALSHNNGNWLNKVEPPAAEVRRADELAGDLGLGGGNLPLVLDVLVSVLDANRAGDIETVFDVAVRYNDDVGIDLRRLRRQVGV